MEEKQILIRQLEELSRDSSEMHLKIRNLRKEEDELLYAWHRKKKEIALLKSDWKKLNDQCREVACKLREFGVVVL